MRILVAEQDAGVRALVKERIANALPECTIVDFNPEDGVSLEPTPVLAGKKVSIVSTVDSHAIQTIFRRNRPTKKKLHKSRTVIKLESTLNVLGINEAWLGRNKNIGIVGDKLEVSTIAPFLVGRDDNNKVHTFTDYSTAYACCDVLILVGDVKYTVTADDRFKIVK